MGRAYRDSGVADQAGDAGGARAARHAVVAGRTGRALRTWAGAAEGLAAVSMRTKIPSLHASSECIAMARGLLFMIVAL